MTIRVFYLDDEQQLCNVFKEFIEDQQLQVTTFTKAEEAVLACQTQQPDIMFIDYRLAETTGLSVANRLGDTFPKILVTGELNIPQSNLFEKIISKPFKLAEIKSLILAMTNN